jgi:predicted homoserine dehydrogenase-like protein
MLRAVKAGQPLKWSDVAFDANSTAVKTRREMERTFGRQASAAALEA